MPSFIVLARIVREWTDVPSYTIVNNTKWILMENFQSIYNYMYYSTAEIAVLLFKLLTNRHVNHEQQRFELQISVAQEYLGRVTENTTQLSKYSLLALVLTYLGANKQRKKAVMLVYRIYQYMTTIVMRCSDTYIPHSNDDKNIYLQNSF